MSWLAYAQAGFAGHAFTWISPPAGHARHLGSQQWGVGRHGTLGIDQRWHFDLAARFGRTPDRPRAPRPDDARGSGARARGAAIVRSPSRHAGRAHAAGGARRRLRGGTYAQGLGARDRRLARRACRRSGRARRGKRGPARARSGDRTTRRRRGGNPRPDRRLAPAELAGRAAGLALARLLPIKAPTGLACRHGRADPAAFRKTSSAMTAKP